MLSLNTSCDRSKPTEPWPANTDPAVFGDTFGADAQYQAFAGSKLDAIAIDSTVKFVGTASLRITVPAPGDPSGAYAGGAVVAGIPRDLSGYDALSFWVRGSRSGMLDVAGLGNDNTGTSRYEAKRNVIPFTTAWSHVLVPIPLAAKLNRERGLFFFAEGPQGGAGFTIWLDDVQFVALGTITSGDIRPILLPRNLNAFAGSTVNLDGSTQTIFDLGGVDTAVTVIHAPRYFTFASSDPSVARVSDGVVQVMGTGNAAITAKLGEIDATGTVNVTALAPPASAAPTPTVPASSVVSLYSNAYANVTVDTWSATWDQADVSDITIAGNASKVYTNLVYAGIEFTTHPIDASSMTAFHLDLWTPSGTTFKVKLVDFGADGSYGGTGDNRDSEHELTFNAASTPPLATGSWVGLEIPLASFANLASRAHLAQLVLSGDTRTVFVDNVYFHQ